MNYSYADVRDGSLKPGIVTVMHSYIIASGSGERFRVKRETFG